MRNGSTPISISRGNAPAASFVYNDNVHFNYFLDGHYILITDNVVIRESTYELGLTEEYLRILTGAAEIKYADRDIPGLYKLKPMHAEVILNNESTTKENRQ